MEIPKPRRIRDRKLLDHEKSKPCSVSECRKASDPDHIRSRGSGGHDTSDNILPLCRSHHTERGTVGWGVFLMKYPHVEEILEKKGWILTTRFGVKKLVRK